MEEDHKHFWKTRWVTIHGVDCPSGMICECGAILDQLEVEDALNGVKDHDR